MSKARETGPATYDDLLKVPDTMVAEILDGELYATPRPASPHAHTASMMAADLISRFGHPPGDPGVPGGWWILIEPELHLGPDVIVPDLAGWRRERMPLMPNAPFFTLAPDFVSEIASPRRGRVDRVKKLPIYAREGVRHAWIVDPLERTLEVLGLEGGRWVLLATHGGDERVRAEPFAAIELDLARWWLPEAP
ncbi:MAG TPA: Uma2 family endonuclease [Polyangia bacterium]|jgi:Uma2 family endonuclease